MIPDSLGPYRLGDPLGKGGMGTVYRGVHKDSDDVVAVKVLDPRLAMAEGFRDRFESEIESLKALRHAGIVRLFGYGEQDGALFYAMELIEGPTLEDELRNGRRFSWREATQVGIQVARALKHAHDHGVIHRDLKPSNILLAEDGNPKLADFGIARIFGATSVTIAGGVLGTADYMSPEQAAGKPVNARCDQYSLGGVLYALLAGRPPFRATDLAAMLQLQRFAIPEPVRRFAPDTPLEMERIVAKMLEKDPTDRFPNTQVVARRLEAMAQGLARVAADDFEVYQTGETPAANLVDGPAPDEEIDMAATREATTEAVADLNPQPVRAIAPAVPTSLSSATSYTHVESSGSEEPISDWPAIAGQAGVLAIAIATMAAAAWWFSRPPSADELFDRVSRSASEMDASNIALENVSEFNRRFPDDERVQQVGEWGRVLRLEQMRRKLQLARLGGLRATDASPEEALMKRAAALASKDPVAGAEAFDGLAELIRAGEDSSRKLALADVAEREAQRLRDAAADERAKLAAYCLEKLVVAEAVSATDPARAKAIATAVIELLPAGSETTEALVRARAMLHGEEDGSGVAE